MHSRPAAVPAMLFACGVLFGCVLLDEDSNDPFSRVPDGDGGHASGRSSRSATWVHMRVWTAAGAGETGPAASGTGPIAIKSEKLDIAAAGLKLSMDSPPKTEYATVLVRGSQSGFAAISRGEARPPFEAGGRALGGPDVPLDAGLEVSARILPSDELEIKLAPLFRKSGAARDDEIRAGRHEFSVTVPNRTVLRIEGHERIASPVLRALLVDAGGGSRRLWIQVEAIR